MGIVDFGFARPFALQESVKSPLGGFMEVAELKTVIGALEARVDKIRDWL